MAGVDLDGVRRDFQDDWRDGWRDEWMVAPDGVRLATRLWRPPVGEGPWPALLMRQPYGRRIASTVVYAHPRWYAAQGFLVAVQDVRGRGDSDGRFGGFAQEGEDGRSALGWLRRHPACNGRVGTYGFSYQGLSQLLIGVGGGDPEELPDALAPAMCGLDERRHWAAEGGAHWWAQLVGWGLQLAGEGCRRRGDGEGWLEIRRCLEDGSWPRQGLELLRRHDPDGMVSQWLALDPAEPRGWRIHEPCGELLRRPLLLIGGWHDPHLRGVLDLWRRSRAAGGDPELVIGAWSHLHWHGGVDGRQIAFFRRHLQNAGGGGEPTVALQCVTRGDWLSPAPSRLGEPPAPPEGWTLHSGGLAGVRSDEGELRPLADYPAGKGGVTLVHDPWRPVPGRGGHLGPEAGVLDRADLDHRADVACFTTAPLLEDLELLGEPRLEIGVRAEPGGFDLCAALSVLPAPGAQVRQLSGGVRRHRGGQGAELEPVRLSLRLQPLRATVAAGERLRLSLAGAAWPQIAVHPGHGDLPPGPSGPGHRVISLELRLEEARLWLTPLAGAD